MSGIQRRTVPADCQPCFDHCDGPLARRCYDQCADDDYICQMQCGIEADRCILRDCVEREGCFRAEQEARCVSCQTEARLKRKECDSVCDEAIDPYRKAECKLRCSMRDEEYWCHQNGLCLARGPEPNQSPSWRTAWARPPMYRTRARAWSPRQYSRF